MTNSHGRVRMSVQQVNHSIFCAIQTESKQITVFRDDKYDVELNFKTDVVAATWQMIKKKKCSIYLAVATGDGQLWRVEMKSNTGRKGDEDHNGSADLPRRISVEDANAIERVLKHVEVTGAQHFV